MFQTLFADGYHTKTMTTYEDPALRLEMYTDGNNWYLSAYVYDKEIDRVNLETVRTKYMERIIEKTGGINISVDMNYAGQISGQRMLQEYLAETLETVKGLDYAFGPENPANWK